MRRLALIPPLLILLVAAGAAPVAGETGSPLVRLPLGEGAFVSDNVTYMGTIPIEAIGGRMLECGDQTRFYVTGVPGLVIYDVTEPMVPVPLGTLPLPHFQNEDVDVSDDCNRVIISTDTVHAGPNASGSVSAGGGSLRIIDTSNPLQPQVVGYLGASNHTATCADPACEWIYGSSGRIYDATDPSNIVDTGRRWRPDGGGGHALNRDQAGIVISDSNPRYVLDPMGTIVDGATPLEPGVLAQGRPRPGFSDRLQHNNVRVGATEWEPRDPEAADYDDPTLRPGELLIANSESNVNPACSNSGGLSSWSMINFDKGEDLQQLEMFRPFNGTWVDGNPAVNGLGCSGHWFTVRDHMIAAAWYEHGLRFIAVDPETGAFEERGFFNPVATEMGAAHWVTAPNGDEFVYTTDYARGIDIVRFERSMAGPSQAEIVASWLANLGTVGPSASAERFHCTWAMEGVRVG